ncbi:hypothetical protein [Flavobacterium sp. JP2137]|uniref:hypothetical protein n=1 Tax=Flavobacterium sp. JP2137 TaxID=3414510 RepID=UPI003D301563
MKKLIPILVLVFSYEISYSQKVLASWSQQNIENYTKAMYDEAQKLTAQELVQKNLTDQSWSAVFLTLNASLNNYLKDKDYLSALTRQLTDNTVTKLQGTNRLIIWERITTNDIVFEGKGLVMDNDLFTVSGRANQILQNLTNKNFGYVTPDSTKEDLELLQKKWSSYLADQPVDQYTAAVYQGAKIPEICSLQAVHALVVSLQANPAKDSITSRCLDTVYGLEQMPAVKGNPASFCNPDTYTYAYLGMLFGDDEMDETKNATWWLNFWTANRDKLVWNSERGIYLIK